MAKKAVAKTAEVVDLVPANEDERAVAELGGIVLGFFSGLAGFLSKAREFEEHAKRELDIVRTLPAPVTPSDDVAIQRVVLAAADDNKAVEAHWNPVTSAFHRLHKTLTGARGRAFDANEERRRIANRHHNDFVERKAREAREQEERDRRERERRAQEDRDRELAAAEAAALKNEAASKDLSDREQRFVEMVYQGHAPRTAAQRAGYKDPVLMCERLMQTAKITAAIEGKRTADRIREQAAATAAKPLDVQVEEVKPDVARATGAHDRTTHSAEIVDENALIAAVIAGGHGIPWDILTVKPAKVNDYAKGLKEQINRWPGVRYKKTTGVSR